MDCEGAANHQPLSLHVCAIKRAAKETFHDVVWRPLRCVC